MKFIKTNFTLPEPILSRLRSHCGTKGFSMSGFLAQLLDENLPYDGGTNAETPAMRRRAEADRAAVEAVVQYVIDKGTIVDLSRVIEQCTKLGVSNHIFKSRIMPLLNKDPRLTIANGFFRAAGTTAPTTPAPVLPPKPKELSLEEMEVLEKSNPAEFAAWKKASEEYFKAKFAMKKAPPPPPAPRFDKTDAELKELERTDPDAYWAYMDAAGDAASKGLYSDD